MLAGVADPQSLLEVSAQCISERTFDPVPSLKCLQGGFRQAPDIALPMAAMFCKVQGLPKHLKDSSVPEVLVLEEKYAVAVQQFCSVIRQLVYRFKGYECKEAEPGKFTLVFPLLQLALAFAMQAQKELLEVDWSEEILAMDAFKEHKSTESEHVIWRGLSAHIGVTWGHADFFKLLPTTGHADYYGPLPNKAARLMGQAQCGQVVVDRISLHEVFGVLVPNGSGIPEDAVESNDKSLLSFTSRNINFKRKRNQKAGFSNPIWESEIEVLDHVEDFEESLILKGIGAVTLKGFHEKVDIVQVSIIPLDERPTQTHGSQSHDLSGRVDSYLSTRTTSYESADL
mmetsp:Transcript_26695/g.36847  ORF Transcript_26695/g.36847 Transcript_26695/m.36847 type:complete len:342 (+) Transcript_26695:240-1265(+)